MKVRLMNDFDSTIQKLIRYPHVNEILFIVLVVLCFMGDLLGEFSGHVAVFYWLAMIPVFFSITLIKEKAKEKKTGVLIANFTRNNFFFWMSALTSTLLILFLWHAGDLNAKASALAIHIIFAHTLFLLGTLAGLRFYLIGIFLFLTAGITTQFEGFVGITILLIVPVLFLGFYYDNHKKAVGEN